jgi:hypothetical protein
MRTIFFDVVPRTSESSIRNDALAFDRGAIGRMLHAHAEFAHALGRLNEGPADIVVSDDAEFERHAGMLAITEGGGHAGIRHRHHDVDLDMAFARELGAKGFSDFVHRAAADDRIRPREVDVFEDAGPRRLRWKRLVAVCALFIEYDDFAGFDVPDIFCADHVERAGLGRQDRTAVEVAEHQRPDAERVAGADQLLVGQGHQRIGTLDRAQRLDETVDETTALGLRHQMQDHFGVGGRLHHGAVKNKLAAQRQAIGEIAVMADRKTAGIELGEQRLHVAQNGGACGGVADMADGGVARQALDDFAAGEGVADEAEAAFGMEAGAVKGDDAGGFLAAVLEGV